MAKYLKPGLTKKPLDCVYQFIDIDGFSQGKRQNNTLFSRQAQKSQTN
jgi:hypothetical protein